jgi:hypothetical protein
MAETTQGGRYIVGGLLVDSEGCPIIEEPPAPAPAKQETPGGVQSLTLNSPRPRAPRRR